MTLRPGRKGKTYLLYLWGNSGVGKTSAVEQVLNAFEELGTDYYSKGGGLKKYWDGYDNQPIAWIDDPINMDGEDKDSIQELKNVISSGKCYVEVKHGWMSFDSELIIITSNMSPEVLAQSCGEVSKEAVFRRLTDTCGSHLVAHRPSIEFKKYMFNLICHVLDIVMPWEVFEEKLRPIHHKSFAGIKYRN